MKITHHTYRRYSLALLKFHFPERKSYQSGISSASGSSAQHKHAHVRYGGDPCASSSESRLQAAHSTGTATQATPTAASHETESCTVLLGSRGYSRRRASEVPARHVQHAYMRAPRAWHFNQAFEKENPKEAMREARPSDASWPVSRQAARCEWFCGGDRRSHNQTAKVQSDAVQYVCSCMWSRAS